MTVREKFREKGFPMVGNLVLTTATPEILAKVCSSLPEPKGDCDGLLFAGEDHSYDFDHALDYLLDGQRLLYFPRAQEVTHAVHGNAYVKEGWYLPSLLPSAFLDQEMQEADSG